ncbi:MAG: amidohydrolase [Acetobacteraceae bacterium]|nr:amidohydrolase [Acetobacteraceae bacterium]
MSQSQTGGLGPLVDTHAHIYPRNTPLIEGATHKPVRDVSPEEYTRVLDEHGVLFGVHAAASFMGPYNDYTLAALARYPRLRATAIVEPSVSLHELKAMDAAGVVGIRFSLRDYKGTPDFGSIEFRRLFRRVADLDWHVHVYAEGERIAALTDQLLATDVKIVIDHYGNPTAAMGENSPGFQAALRAIGSGRGWVKVSAPYRSVGCDHATLAARLLAEGGPERILFASDWPFVGHESQITYRQMVESFERVIPDAVVREKIGRTAARLYKFA